MNELINNIHQNLMLRVILHVLQQILWSLQCKCIFDDFFFKSMTLIYFDYSSGSIELFNCKLCDEILQIWKCGELLKS